MCRLLAIPAGFSRKEAIQILLDMQAMKNRDGVGSVYVEDGKFNIIKYPKSLAWVLRKGKPFLDHLPHKGWTLIHLRAASHGNVTMENTHPFEVGDWCVAHNGIWSEHNIASLLMQRLGKIRMVGETDSEVAANFLNIVGPDRFTEELDYSGTFIALNRDGTLYAMRTSGDLEALERGKQIVLSSEFDYRGYSKEKTYTVVPGCYHFAANGTVLEKNPMKYKMMVGKGLKPKVYSQGYALPRAGSEIEFAGRSCYDDDDDDRLFNTEFADAFVGGEPEGVGSIPSEEDRDKIEREGAYQRFLDQAMNIKRGPEALGIKQGPNSTPIQYIDPLVAVGVTKGTVDMTKYLLSGGRKRGCRRGLPPSQDPALVITGEVVDTPPPHNI